MNFFIKYRLPFNIVLMLFWLFIIYDTFSSEDFKYQKIIIPVLFIILSIFNIFKTINSNNSKSED
jgi:hypothetical protein